MKKQIFYRDDISSLFFLIFIMLMTSCTHTNTIKCSVNEVMFNKEKNNLINELLEMQQRDQYLRLKLDTIINVEKKKTIYKEIRKIDIENTQRLIQITKKYGFPSVKRLGKPIPIWVVFQHTPEIYNKEVGVLIEKEYKCKRIPELEYKMLKWHLGGRKGIPFSL